MYSVNGGRHFGIHARAYFFRNSAEEYAKRFIPKWKVTVRYGAVDPDKSLVPAHDQLAHPDWATRYRGDDVPD
jgi:hypothetical protein